MATSTSKSGISAIDKKILKVLLDPEGKITSDQLAKRIGLPRTTVQRRRRQLEKKFLQLDYTLKLQHLGFRRIDLLISTQSGRSVSIAKLLLDRDEVVYVGRTVGQHTVDLKAEVIIQDNEELIDLLEVIKGIEGVRQVEWIETIKVVGRKKSIPGGIIDRL